MGVCYSEEGLQSYQHERKLKAHIAKQKELQADTLRLLLVGAGESGKSTVLKQMKIINNRGQPFTASELIQLRKIAQSNVWKTFEQLVQGAEDLKLTFEGQAATCAESVMDTEFTEIAENVDAIRDILVPLRTDSTIAQVLENKKVHLLDSASYWLKHFDRVLSADFQPTTDDCLRTRQATSGVIETNLTFDQTVFQFIDVGGQRGERRKWIHSFEHIAAMFYVASLTGYCQVLEEDPTQNRLRESLSLFHGLLGLPWFTSTPVILFLNKDDVFREKLSQIPLEDYFAEFEPPEDAKGDPEAMYEECVAFITDLFRFQANTINPDVKLFPHVTTATDTSNCERVWTDAKTIVIDASVNASFAIDF